MPTLELGMYITIDPTICHGKPVFKGSRILVQQVLELLEAGLTASDITSPDYFPQLSPEHIQAALRYAGELLKTRQYA